MEIVLKKDLPGIGYKDECVVIKNGYGNYLIARGDALLATTAQKKIALENVHQVARQLEQKKAEASLLAEKLAQMEVTVHVKVSDKGTIFGSVTPLQLIQVIQKQDMTIQLESRQIKFPEAIEGLGKHKAKVQLFRDITVEIEFYVSPEA